MSLSFGRAVIYVTDQQRSLDFYTKVLGCTLLHDGPGPNGLRFTHIGFEGQGNVGIWLFAQQAVNPSDEPILVLYTKDLEETYQSMLDNGVAIINKPSDSGSSKHMHIADPDGNVIVIALMPYNYSKDETMWPR